MRSFLLQPVITNLPLFLLIFAMCTFTIAQNDLCEGQETRVDLFVVFDHSSGLTELEYNNIRHLTFDFIKKQEALSFRSTLYFGSLEAGFGAVKSSLVHISPDHEEAFGRIEKLVSTRSKHLALANGVAHAYTQLLHNGTSMTTKKVMIVFISQERLHAGREWSHDLHVDIYPIILKQSYIVRDTGPKGYADIIALSQNQMNNIRFIDNPLTATTFPLTSRDLNLCDASLKYCKLSSINQDLCINAKCVASGPYCRCDPGFIQSPSSLLDCIANDQVEFDETQEEQEETQKQEEEDAEGEDKQQQDQVEFDETQEEQEETQEKEEEDAEKEEKQQQDQVEFEETQEKQEETQEQEEEDAEEEEQQQQDQVEFDETQEEQEEETQEQEEEDAEEGEQQQDQVEFEATRGEQEETQEQEEDTEEEEEQQQQQVNPSTPRTKYKPSKPRTKYKPSTPRTLSNPSTPRTKSTPSTQSPTINNQAPVRRPAPAQNVAVLVAVSSSIRMPDLQFSDDQFGSMDKPAARDLAMGIETQMNKDLVDKVPFFVNSKVVGFRAGSIIADVEVIVKAEDTQGEEVTAEVTGAMTEMVKTGRMGDYNLDPSYEGKSSFRIDEVEKQAKVVMNDDDEEDEGNVLIGVAAAIGIVVALAAASAAVAYGYMRVGSSAEEEEVEEEEEEAGTVNKVAPEAQQETSLQTEVKTEDGIEVQTENSNRGSNRVSIEITKTSNDDQRRDSVQTEASNRGSKRVSVELAKISNVDSKRVSVDLAKSSNVVSKAGV